MESIEKILKLERYKIYRIEEVKEGKYIFKVKVKSKSVRIVMSILQVFMTD